MTAYNSTITSANDGGNVPTNAGLPVGDGDSLLITGSGTIAGFVQIKLADGTWDTLPDANSATTIDGPATLVFNTHGQVRIAVTTATGTMKYEFR